VACGAFVPRGAFVALGELVARAEFGALGEVVTSGVVVASVALGPGVAPTATTMVPIMLGWMVHSNW
jgi:hypothetical protein